MCAFRGKGVSGFARDECGLFGWEGTIWMEGEGDGGLPSMFVSCSVRMYVEDNANNFLFQRRSRKELSGMISWFGPALFALRWFMWPK